MFYNLWQMTVWSLLLGLTFFYLAIDPLAKSHSPYHSNHIWRCILWAAQGSCAFDIPFSIMGLTKNSALAPTLQIISRIYVLLVIFPIVPTDFRFLITLTTAVWAQSEIVRFTFYTVKGNKAIAWLRYNLFLVCQPLGALAELVCISLAYAAV